MDHKVLVLMMTMPRWKVCGRMEVLVVEVDPVVVSVFERVLTRGDSRERSLMRRRVRLLVVKVTK